MTASVQRSQALAPRRPQGGLAGGFLFAFHLPVRGANVPVQPADVTEGKFAPNAFIRIDETGRTTLIMPQVEMGQGVYTSIPQLICRRTRRRHGEGCAAARTAERQALWQPDLRPAGDRQFEFDPRLLQAAAHRRRHRARHAGAGRRRAMAGRTKGLHDLKGRDHRMPPAAASSAMARSRLRRPR